MKYSGFYADLSNEDYHDDRSHYSSSVLKQAIKDPKEFKRIYVDGGERKKMNETALAVGNFCHIALLEPHLLDVETAIFHGARRQGKAWEMFKHENEGKTIITSSQYDMVETMIKEFNATSVDLGGPKETPCTEIFKNGFAEESLFQKAHGLGLKVRFDYRLETKDGWVIRDLKTTSRTANTPYEATQICNDFGYFLSAALYCDMAEKATGLKHDFQLVFLSKQDFRTNVYKVSEESLEIGRQQYKKAIKLIKEWKKTGRYSTGLREI